MARAAMEDLPLSGWLLLPEGHAKTHGLGCVGLQPQRESWFVVGHNPLVGEFPDHLLESLVVWGLPHEC